MTTKERSDALYELFAAAFEESFEIPYRNTTADFVQLTRLIKAVPDLKSEYWERAVHNFLTSPMGRYTIHDLASRVEVFAKTRLNQYGKPVNSVDQLNRAALSDWIGH